MTKPLPGDTVCCKVNAGFIVYSYIDRYETIESFDIICNVDGGYLIKVPSHLFLANSILINSSRIKEYLVPKNFMGADAHFITDAHISSIKCRKDGEICDRCGDFAFMATRKVDGKFKCFLCLQYPYR